LGTRTGLDGYCRPQDLGLLRGSEKGGDALLVARGGILMHDALLGGAIDFRLELGEELHGFIRLAGLGQSADFLFGSAYGADLNAITGAAAHGGAGLLGSGLGISHSPPNCRNPGWMSMEVCVETDYHSAR
jgi:hypothetical protein